MFKMTNVTVCRVVLLSIFLLVSVSPALTTPALTTTTTTTTTSTTITPTMTTTTTTQVHIPYTCDLNGNVDVHLPKDIYDHVVIDSSLDSAEKLTLNGTNDKCSNPLRSYGQNSSIIHLKECEVNQSIYIYLLNSSQNNIIGGKHFQEYEIKCELPAYGTIRNTTFEFNATARPVPTAVNEHMIPNLTLSMSIQPNSSIYVGETLTLTITETTTTKVDKKPYLFPKRCIAKGSGETDHVDLYDNYQPKEKELIETFSNNTGSIFATLYAFRFLSGPTVTISCSVKLCPDPTCTHTRRRRRSLNNNDSNDHIQVVEGSFQVMSTSQSSKSGVIRVTPSSNTMMAVFTMTAAIILHR